MNEQKEVNILSADQDAQDNTRHTVTAAERTAFERLADQIRAELMRTGGSAIDPRNVLAALRSVIDGRYVPAGFLSNITLHPHVVVPVPLHIWIRIAWLPLELLGLRWPTRRALYDMHIRYVGNLLLYSEYELGQNCDLHAITDIQQRLGSYGLRLPTPEELAAAKEAGFWVGLPDEVNGRIGSLRIARELAAMVPITELVQLRSVGENGFFEWAEISTVGDLLAQTQDDLYETVQDFVVGEHTGWDSNREEELSDKTKNNLMEEVKRLNDIIIEWVAAAELQFGKDGDTE